LVTDSIELPVKTGDQEDVENFDKDFFILLKRFIKWQIISGSITISLLFLANNQI